MAQLDGGRVPLGTFDTFAAATDAFAAATDTCQHAEASARRGTAAGLLAGRRPFAEVAEEYLRTQQLAASTRKSCTSHVRRHLIPRFETVPVADLTPAMVGAWMSDEQKAGVALRSRLSHRSTLSSILQWAVNSGRRPATPVHVVRAPARAPLRRRRPVLEPEQWPQLRREFHDSAEVVAHRRAPLQLDPLAAPAGTRGGSKASPVPSGLVQVRYSTVTAPAHTVTAHPFSPPFQEESHEESRVSHARHPHDARGGRRRHDQRISARSRPSGRSGGEPHRRNLADPLV